MALDLGELSGTILFDADPATRTLRAFGQDITAFEQTMRTAGTDAGAALGDGVYRGADGRLRDAQNRFVSEARDVGRETGDALGDSAADAADDGGEQTASRFGKGLKAGAAGLAVVAGSVGAAAAAGLMEGMEREVSLDRLNAALGNPGQAEANARIVKKIYGDAYGETLDEVAQAVESVRTTVTDLEPGQGRGLKALTEQAFDFATVLGVEVPRSVQIAQQMVTTGLADNVSEAFDLMLAGTQKKGFSSALREDLMDALDEYGPFFAALGVSGEQAVSALSDGSAQGMFGIDKYGDAIKEFTILSTDMSTSSVDAYKKIGLNAKDMSNDFLAGGDRSKAAFGKVVDGLLGIEDRTAQANTAIALFGTPLEDLGVAKIPGFLESLRDSEAGLGDWEGATKRAGETLNDNGTLDFTAFKRRMQTEFVDFIEVEVLPAVDRLAEKLADGDAPEQMAQLWEDIRPSVEDFGSWLMDDFIPAVADAYGDLSETLSTFGEDIASTLEEHPEVKEFLGELVDFVGDLAVNGIPTMVAMFEAGLPIITEGFALALDAVEQLAVGLTYVGEYGAISAGYLLDAFGWTFEQIATFLDTTIGGMLELVGIDNPFDGAAASFREFREGADEGLDDLKDGAKAFREQLQEEITPNVNTAPAAAEINRLIELANVLPGILDPNKPNAGGLSSPIPDTGDLLYPDGSGGRPRKGPRRTPTPSPRDIDDAEDNDRELVGAGARRGGGNTYVTVDKVVTDDYDGFVRKADQDRDRANRRASGGMGGRRHWMGD